MKIYHWWPGREWKRGFCPIPEKYVKNAERMGSRYMTVATDGESCGVSYCRWADQVDKKVGTIIAHMRLVNGL